MLWKKIRCRLEVKMSLKCCCPVCTLSKGADISPHFEAWKILSLANSVCVLAKMEDPIGHALKQIEFRYVILLKGGVYNENVEIAANNVTLIGEGKDRSFLVSSRNERDGVHHITDQGALMVLGDAFIAKHITVKNISDNGKEQAVALKCDINRSAYYDCDFISYQDTVYAKGGKQFFRNCNISGSVDFIFGDASTVIQNCNIFMRSSGFITAQGRQDQTKNTGISIDRCHIGPTPEFNPKHDYAYLGRPWFNFSRVIIMRTYIDKIINPAGWHDWEGRSKTAEYMEFENSGPGAVDCMSGPKERVKWPGYRLLCRKEDAEPFSVDKFIDGSQWLPGTGIPYDLGI